MDPATQAALVWLLSFIPSPYKEIIASAIGIFGMMSLGANLISRNVKPPSAEAPKWVQTTYKVLTWPALNGKWARNAVLPGMPVAVQAAAKEMAEIAAAAPEKTIVVAPLAGAAVVAPKPGVLAP